MNGMKYEDYEIQLEPGDIIFEYTDGVTEAVNESDEMFGTQRMSILLTALLKRQEERSAQRISQKAF